jgi:hypothetical protein
MYNLLSQAVCRHCGHILRGRSDKQFCDDSCRNQFNNRLNREHHLLMRKVHNILRRNKKILEDIRKQGQGHVPAEMLRQEGFSFRHCTAIETQSGSPVLYYCYDEVYRWVSEEAVEVFQVRERL